VSVRLTELDGVTVVALPTDVDASNAARVRKELVSAVPHGSRDVVVDLRDTRYLDSAGIDMLFRLGQRLTERRAELRIVLPATSQLRRLAAIVGLEREISVHETLAEAVSRAREARAPLGRRSDATGDPPKPTHSAG
jgi:anti-anti-sigma factor